MMRAFDDRGKGGIITLEEFEDEVAGGFGKVSTRLLAGESRVVSARFFGDAPGRSPFVFTYGPLHQIVIIRHTLTNYMW